MWKYSETLKTGEHKLKTALVDMYREVLFCLRIVILCQHGKPVLEAPSFV